jgi:hypothetical protein
MWPNQVLVTSVLLFNYVRLTTAEVCNDGKCNDCGNAASDCLDLLADQDAVCTERCYNFPVFDGFVECIIGCIDAVNAGSNACDETADSCRAQYCENTGECTIGPSNPPETDPIPNPDPEPESPTRTPTVPVTLPPPPPATTSAIKCDYQYVSGTCPVNAQSANCLSQGKALLQLSSPATNGCGGAVTGTSFFDYLTTLFNAGLGIVGNDFKSCCNNHDMCWGTCSGGNDYLFDRCNSQFFDCMLATCRQYGSILQNASGSPGLASNPYEFCLSRASIFYSAVQGVGCGFYNSAQDIACTCVDCVASIEQGVPGGGFIPGPGRIVINDPIRSTCSTAGNVRNDWSGFRAAFTGAMKVANSVDASGLNYYGSLIGVDALSVSPQILTITQSCGRTLSRRYEPRSLFQRSASYNSNKRALALSNYFTSIADTDLSLYGCGANVNDTTCSTSLALIAIAGLSRQIEAYAGETKPPAMSSVSSTILTSPSFVPTSSEISSASTTSSPSPAPSASLASENGTDSSVTSANIGTTTALTVPNQPQTSVSSSTAPDSSSAKDAAPSIPSIPSSPGIKTTTSNSSSASVTSLPSKSASSQRCTLVKHFGDSPDSESEYLVSDSSRFSPDT